MKAKAKPATLKVLLCGLESKLEKSRLRYILNFFRPCFIVFYLPRVCKQAPALDKLIKLK